MVNEFKVGDKVAHEEHGNGEVKEADGFLLWCWFDDITPAGRYCRRGELRPRNFLAKIAEEQKCECGNPEPHEKWEPECNLGKSAEHAVRSPDDPDLDSLRRNKTVSQQFSEVFKQGRFQRNAYGQLVDTVTGLPADSEGIVAIRSIKDTVRGMG